MPIAKNPAVKKSAAQPAEPSSKPPRAKRAGTSASRAKDALALLRADHRLVSDLFAAYEKARVLTKKTALVAQICTELTVHAQIEEEVFYPAVKQALRDKVLVPQATVKHATLKDLIAQVQDKPAQGELFDAKIKVLSEYVKHHVKEEQNDLFPKVRQAKLDLRELGTQMVARKEALQHPSSTQSEQSANHSMAQDAVAMVA